MNETREHRLSAWLDDEISDSDADRLLSDLSRDAELKQTLGRYHLVSNYLRGEPLRTDALDMAERVGQALRDEPAVLAPAAGRRENKLVRYLGGGAIAASVALVAVLSLSDDPQAPMEPPTIVARAPLDTGSTPDAVADAQLRSLASSVVEQQQVESRLDRILAEHTEYAGSGGMQGILPYTTFVSYDVR